MSCGDWNPALRAAVTNDWSALLTAVADQIVERLSKQAPPEGSSDTDPLRSWFLEFCDRSDQYSYLYIERRSDGWQACQVERRPAAREFGLRLHAQDLLNLLESRILLEHISLGGAFRYHAPPTADLESIRERVLGPLQIICRGVS